MRALQSMTAESPLRLNHIPLPAPGPGEIRIRVIACGLNYPDLVVIEDRYQTKLERPFTPGFALLAARKASGKIIIDVAA